MKRATADATLIAMSSPRRLLGFVLCSAALHGLVLSAAQSMPSVEHVRFGEPALQVKMESRSRSSTTSNAQNVLAAQPGHRLNEVTRVTRDDPVSSRTDTPTPADAGARDSQALQNYLRGVLHSELSRHLRYPQLARERGWQGTVMVGVMIAPDGALIATRLFRSSGHTLLDEASLTGLSRVRSLPMHAAARQTDPVEVILPILFRLTDNT